jgi:hypothetical protein
VTLASLVLAALAIVAVARARGASFKPRPLIIVGAVVIGALSIGVFLAGHHPWSVTFGFTVWGAKIASLFGADFSGAAFWQWPGPKRALAESILSDTSSLTDLGMILGAMAAAAATKPFARTAWPPARSLFAAAIGGLLMGVGCAASGSAATSAPSSAASRPARCMAGSGSRPALGGCMIGSKAAPAVRPVARLSKPCGSSMHWC